MCRPLRRVCRRIGAHAHKLEWLEGARDGTHIGRGARNMTIGAPGSEGIARSEERDLAQDHTLPGHAERAAAATLSLPHATRSIPAAGAPPVTAWDPYELLELLGRGGMGSVYRAYDRRLDRPLAIKFLLGADPDPAPRFLREARAKARIDPPNVCRVYEVGEIQGRAYIALQ